MFLEDCVTKKWKYLRDKYLAEMKKERKSKTGMSAEERYVSQWHFMEMLRFLTDFGTAVTKEDTLTNMVVRCSISQHLISLCIFNVT
jgi:hypothetical protein